MGGCGVIGNTADLLVFVLDFCYSQLLNGVTCEQPTSNVCLLVFGLSLTLDALSC